MLLLAILLLLLAAVGLVVAALVTGHIVLAWGSVGISAVVAVALPVLRRRVRRRSRAAAEAALEDEEQDDAPVDPQLGTGVQPLEPSPAAAEVPDSATQSSDEPREHAAPADAAAPGADAEPTESDAPDDSDATDEDADAEPDEEDTDAADLLVVWEMSDEVLVVDEHPRYHLARCAWPDPARTERLPVREARELGFTPCAQCRPDASLARRLRGASAKQDAASG
ncbi:MAG: hypothetical protein ACRDTE_20245 [Pseudonocardiaceae bacterium]